MGSRGLRPEHTGSADLYYNEEVSYKYATNSHIVSIQTDMSERALELLALPEDKSCFLLDVGCGSGISGSVLSAGGHIWVGMDISRPMLLLAKEDEDNTGEGDVLLKDMGTGLPFRPGTFEGCISISAIQWLCHANANEENPRKRLSRFFQSLYACLCRGSRAVFQFYPEDERQTELIMAQATRAGFNGGLVVDYPNSTKAKKVYLVLMTGGVQQLPLALTGAEAPRETVDNAGRRKFELNRREKKKRPVKGSKAWITQKKERAVRQGKEVRPDSKYSGRKRKEKF